MLARSLSLIALVTLAACSTPVAARPTGPGFLGSATVYDGLERSSLDPSIFISRSSSRSYVDFQMVMLDPVKVMSPRGTSLTEMEQAQALEIQRMFREVMQVEVGERYPIVDNAGPKTIRLRTAIVDYDPGDEKLLGLGSGASLHAEMVDSISGERIVAAVARTEGRPAPTGRIARQRAHALLTYWARLMRDRMDYERRTR